MKRLVYVLIMILAAVVACQAANKTSKKSTVYYVVLGSYQSLDNAKEHNVKCPDGLEASIVEVTVNGKACYRAVCDCLYSKAQAQKMARDINEHYKINAWVWPSKTRAKVVLAGTALSGEPITLSPR